MRSRNIKPNFFKNEKLAGLKPHARLLFIGLWCMADREGRLEDRPLRIKAELFPYENVKVHDLLNDLWKSGFIVRYKMESNDLKNDLIQILKFKVHQNPHVNERASVLPAPSDIGTLLEDSGTTRADSLLLIPDSLLRIPDTTHSLQKSKRECAFESFWKLYPKKKAKGQAEITWQKVTRTTEPDIIIAGLQRQLPSMQKADYQYLQFPSTWLNAKGWEDEIEVGGKVSTSFRLFSADEEKIVSAAVDLYHSDAFAAAQTYCYETAGADKGDELWVEVMRRVKCG